MNKLVEFVQRHMMLSRSNYSFDIRSVHSMPNGYIVTIMGGGRNEPWPIEHRVIFVEDDGNKFAIKWNMEA